MPRSNTVVFSSSHCPSSLALRIEPRGIGLCGVAARAGAALGLIAGCSSSTPSQAPAGPVGAPQSADSAAAERASVPGASAPNEVAAQTPSLPTQGEPAPSSGARAQETPPSGGPLRDSEAPPTGSDSKQSETPLQTKGGAQRLAVTADFLNQSLTVFDLDGLVPGATRADVEVGSVDLSMCPPAPMSVNVTPDGKTALVSCSGGFLSVFVDVPRGAGRLAFVDLESLSVTDVIDIGDSPMGIVFTPDSKQAFVGLFGENYFAAVDMTDRSFEPIRTGSSFNEELDIDDTGSVGVLTYGPAGNAVTFSVDDPAGTLGATRGLSGDAAGAAFFPNTKIVYLMQAPTALTGNRGGYDLLDVSEPSRPRSIDSARVGRYPTTYPVTAVRARGSVAYPSTQGGVLTVVEVGLTEGSKAEEVQRVTVGMADSLAYGITADRQRVLAAVSGEHYIGVADLETGESFTVPWEMPLSGPTEVKVIPVH